MRIVIVGGGPAGLYFALLMKQRDPSHHVSIFERDGPGDTFGWGIVFSDQTFDYLRENDRSSYAAITAACQTWDNVDIVHRGRRVTVRGNRFSGIARLAFLQILQRRCLELGVDLRFNHPVRAIEELPASDLLVGADGANSLVRRAYADLFEPAVTHGRNKYIWLGSTKLFHGLTLTFVEAPEGLFTAHSYKFDGRRSTFIVECSEPTWRAAGLDAMQDSDACRFLERVFAEHLDGHALLTNDFVRWLNFPLVKNARWHGDRVVLLGDALHTAHFSIGSGTKLALEDAIALAGAFDGGCDPAAALPRFESSRRSRVEQMQQAAQESLRWFEDAAQYLHLDPLPFAAEVMTRSKKIDYENLRQRDPQFVAELEQSSDRKAESGKRRAESGKRRAESGKRKAESG